jgi:hypothetical protein
MKSKKIIVTALLLSGSVGLGGQSLLAQSAPGGGIGPSNPGQTGPTVPQPGPGVPRETQPTIPGQPAPGFPQGQPIPGQRGTIPERVERPKTGGQDQMVVSPDHIKSAQEALKARGHNPGSVSGRMDEKTQQALRDFQKANNLPATGVLDEKTAEKLGVTLDSEKRSIPQGGPDNTMPRSNNINPRGAVK